MNQIFKVNYKKLQVLFRYRMLSFMSSQSKLKLALRKLLRDLMCCFSLKMVLSQRQLKRVEDKLRQWHELNCTKLNWCFNQAFSVIQFLFWCCNEVFLCDRKSNIYIYIYLKLKDFIIFKITIIHRVDIRQRILTYCEQTIMILIPKTV